MTENELEALPHGSYIHSSRNARVERDEDSTLRLFVELTARGWKANWFLLVDAAADPNASNTLGETPTDWSKKYYGNDEVERLLRVL